MSTTLGNNIKNVREKNKETQKDLANYLFISFQSVSKWENGETTPDIYTLVKIAQHYNVSFPLSLKRVEIDSHVNYIAAYAFGSEVIVI